MLCSNQNCEACRVGAECLLSLLPSIRGTERSAAQRHAAENKHIA